MFNKDKSLIISYIKDYPRVTSLSVLAWKYWRDSKGRNCFSPNDDDRARARKLCKARKRALDALSRITWENPALIMEIRLPLQSQSLEFYNSWKIPAPEYETYFALTPGREGQAGE